MGPNFGRNSTSLRRSYWLLPTASLAFLLGLFSLAQGQESQESGQASLVTLNAIGQRPLSLVLARFPGQDSLYWSDMHGRLRIPREQLSYPLRLYHPYYRSPVIRSAEDWPDTLRLTPAPRQLHAGDSQQQNLSPLIGYLQRQLKQKQVYRGRPLKWKTYNRFTVQTRDSEAFKEQLNTLRWLSNFVLPASKEKHHLFFAESFSDRYVVNPHNYSEKIRSQKVTGLGQPSVLALAGGYFPMNLSNQYLKLGVRSFISPFAGNPFKRYRFSRYDSLAMGRNSLLVIHFSGTKEWRSNLLDGLLYVRAADSSLVAIQAWPGDNALLSETYSMRFMQTQGRWLPQWTNLSYQTDEVRLFGMDFLAQTYNYNYDFRRFSPSARLPGMDMLEFDSLPSAEQRQRPLPLSKRDSATLRFYRKLKVPHALSGLLEWGESVYNWRLPVGKVNLNLQKMMGFNEVEGLKPGLGLETNHKLHPHWFGGGFLRYGSRDERFKYGLKAGYRRTYENSSLELRYRFQESTQEPGYTGFGLNRTLYNKEFLRPLRLNRIDYFRSNAAEAAVQPSRHMRLRGSLEHRVTRPGYDYTFLGEPLNRLETYRWQATLRLSPFDRFLVPASNRVSLGTHFPEFWLEAENGWSQAAGQRLPYWKWEAKVQQRFKILGWGETGYQLRGGLANGRLPYSLLFNHRGSFKSLSPVTHNSFETMRFNEFASERYAAFFLWHNLGSYPLHERFSHPELQLMHNMGWGQWPNQALHQDLRAESLEPGYYESGFLVENLILMETPFLDLGLGAGFFVRYGPLALSNNLRNLTTKVTLNLVL